MKKKLARLISDVLNPFVVGAVVITLLAFEDTSGVEEAVSWILIAVVISIVPVLVAVVCLVRFKKLDSFFTNSRQQRYIVYIVASALGVIDCVFFWCIGAPRLLAVTFTAGLIAVVVFMVINYYWKISLHTAFVAGAASALIIVYGAFMAWTLVLIPVMGWARIVMQQHSLGQVVAGGMLSVVVLCGVFWGFGIV